MSVETSPAPPHGPMESPLSKINNLVANFSLSFYLSTLPQHCMAASTPYSIHAYREIYLSFEVGTGDSR